MHTLPRIALTLTAFTALGLTGSAVAADPPALDQVPAGLAAPTTAVSWSGRPVVDLVARRAPAADAARVARISPVGELGGGDLRLLVTDVRRTEAGVWVQVLLPRRPNGVRGWVPADELQLKSSRYRLLIDQSDRRLTVFRGGRAVLRTRVAIGAPATPTPNGFFAVAEAIPTGNPSGFIGPWVLPLTAYSNVLDTFNGGNGRVAVHGTSRPDLLGQRVSHGCIRMANPPLLRMLRNVGPGVPVTIRP